MLYLVDASVYVFRAYYSVPDHLTDVAGRPVNAVYGFAKFVCDLLEKEQPAWLAIAFDESLTTSFRNEIYPDYKANREQAPEDLLTQFGLCRTLCERLGIFSCASPEYEADDLIGSLIHSARPPGEAVAVVTRDKDLAQLIEPGDIFFDYAADVRLGFAELTQRWGVAPTQIADFLALTGDAVDNIPGVPGIGPKTAARLLDAFGDLDTLFAQLQSVAQLSMRGSRRIMELLERHQDDARLARRLTEIKTDIPLTVSEAELRPGDASAQALDEFFTELGFGERLRKQALNLVLKP